MLNRKWIGCELGDCNVIVRRLQNPVRDEEQLSRVRKKSGCLFPEKVQELRKKNGFWICSDNENDKDYTGGMQISLYSDK